MEASTSSVTALTIGSVRTALIVGGVILELVGITLLALDVIADPAAEAAAHARRAARRFGARVVALQRAIASKLRRRRPVVETVTAGGGFAGGMRPTGTLQLDRIPGAESRELVPWLREQMLATLPRVQALQDTADHDREANQAALRDLEVRIQRAICDAVEESEKSFQGWRVSGFALAIAGVTMTLIGSLVAS